MKRFIAKLFIQYYRDSEALNTTQPAFPQWLARWIDRDVELQHYVQELNSLEQTLARQATELVAERTQQQAPVLNPIRVPSHVSISSQPNRNRVLAWGALALAASVLLVMYLRTSNPTTEPQTGGSLASAPSPKEPTPNEKARYQNWIRSRLDAGKRLKSRLEEKRELAQQQIANLDLTLRSDQELIANASRDGLKFFGQKLPAATVRFLGLNQANQLASR